MSCAATLYLAECLAEGKGMDLGRHRQAVQELSAAAKMVQAMAEGGFLESYRGGDIKTKHMLETAFEASAWLMALLQRMNGTKMCNLEFCNALRLHYNFRPLGLETVCNGCGGKFLVNHVMSCKLGGLVLRWHEAVKQEFIHLRKLAFGQLRVIDKPQIPYSRGMQTPVGVTAVAL